MKIGVIPIYADCGVKLVPHLHSVVTAIEIVDPTYDLSSATIYLRSADYERAQRACQAFNSIMSEPDAEQPEAAE